MSKQKKYWHSNNIKRRKNNEPEKVAITNHTCYYFDDIIKIEHFDFNVLLDEELYEKILIYDVLYKNLIAAKPSVQ